jgi:hypothetical protein
MISWIVTSAIAPLSGFYSGSSSSGWLVFNLKSPPANEGIPRDLPDWESHLVQIAYKVLGMLYRLIGYAVSVEAGLELAGQSVRVLPICVAVM